MPEMPPRRTCGTMEVHRRLLDSDPAYAAARQSLETVAFRYAKGRLSVQRTGVSRIQVVVHVVYQTAEQNISDAQVASQIAALNRDYRGKSLGAVALPSPFRDLIADARVEFELARMDMLGRPTSGITRTRTAVAAFLPNDSVKSAAKGGADPWPTDKYLNLWVCPMAGGVLGYAQLPGGPPATDGVVITYGAFGTTGTATAPFNLGCTATHEVGHWLNLLHIWGDDGTGCNGDDFVADTPNQAGPNFGVPSFPHITCDNEPHGDMFVNFMDYTNDAGMQMFTAGQVTRIDATLDTVRAALVGQTPAPPPTPGSHNLDVLFCDRTAGEADLYTFDGQGNPSRLRHYDGWRTTWDLLAPGDVTGTSGPELLVYDRDTGEAEIYAVDAQSNFSLARYEDLRPGWDAIVAGPLTGAGQRNVLVYAKAAGHAELHGFDAQGTRSLLRSYDGWRTSWDAVVAGDLTAAGARSVLFYDRAAGQAEIYALDADGSFSLVKRQDNVGTNWSIVVAGNLTGGGGGHILLYDRQTGEAALCAVGGQDTLMPVRDYIGWSTSWDIIVAGDMSSDSQRMQATLVANVLRRLQPPSLAE